MGATPEGKIKAAIRNVLLVHNCYIAMPVQGGYGSALLDFYGCHRGRFFAIEAKAPGKKPTARQVAILNDIRAAGGKVFVIDSEEELKPLLAWLRGLID